MPQINLLNKERYIDPFLMESRGMYFITEGICEYRPDNFETALEMFYKGIKYITADFGGVEPPPLYRAGLSHYPHFNPVSEEIEEIIDINKFNEKIHLIKNNKVFYNEILGGCFLLTYTQNEKKLNQALELINRIITTTEFTPLSFYTKMKILFRLDKESEMVKEFKLSDGQFYNLDKYAAIKYLKLLVNRKENNVEYLISVLQFYLQVPYSTSVLNLLVKYQFNDFLKISYEKEIVPRIPHFLNDKYYANAASEFRSLINHFFHSNFTYQPGNDPGSYLSMLIDRIEPTKCIYNSIPFLCLFYHLMRKRLDKLQKYRLSEFKKANPEYDEDADDYEYEEPYTGEDFINDVFEGDGSAGWGLE